MSNVYLDDGILTDIADAIRAKTGESAAITPANMATEIGSISGGGAEVPDMYFTGSIANLNSGGNWDWVFEDFANKVHFSNVTYTSQFMKNSQIEDLSGITINFASNSAVLQNMFTDAQNLKVLPNISNVTFGSAASSDYMFLRCYDLRVIPDSFANKIDFSATTGKSQSYGYHMFDSCYSLRSIPTNFLENIAIISSRAMSYLSGFTYSFNYCTSLDELVGLGLDKMSSSSTNYDNVFEHAFDKCYRLKRLTFKLYNGAPYNTTWDSQIIDLSSEIGYSSNNYPTQILDYNSGITSEKKVTNASSYAALKNDPDWWTTDYRYSRYNHDSAVETINTLPKVRQGTIKFLGNSGAYTDGGAINTMTAEETAVATNKGWTVTLV